MSAFSPYTYTPCNPTLRPTATTLRVQSTDVIIPAPSRSEDFEAEVLTRLAAIKETLQTTTAATAQTEVKISKVERFTAPLYRIFRLA